MKERNNKPYPATEVQMVPICRYQTCRWAPSAKFCNNRNAPSLALSKSDFAVREEVGLLRILRKSGQSERSVFLLEIFRPFIPSFSSLIFLLLVSLFSSLISVHPAHASRIIIPRPANNLGLIGYWTFNGPDMIGNVSDRSGTGNTGYLMQFGGATTTELGKYGSAIKFGSGTGASAKYVKILDSDSLDVTDAVTIAAWVYPRSGTNNGIIAKGSLSDGQPTYGLMMSTTNRVMFRLNNADSDVTSQNNTVPFNTWTHVTGTYDSQYQHIYINGALNNTTEYTTAITTDTDDLSLGVYFSTMYPFDGSLDEVRIYNRALSPTEIASLYALRGSKMGTTRKASTFDTSLVGHWTFDGPDMFTNVVDRSGQGNPGFLQGITSTSSAQVAGKFGQALTFDGVNDNVYLGDPSSVKSAYFTLSAWIKKERPGVLVSTGTGGITAEPIIAKLIGESEAPANVNGNYFLGLDSRTMKIVGDYENNTSGYNSPITGTTALATSTWYFVAFTFDGSNKKLYHNGEIDTTVATTALPEATSIQRLGIGGAYNSSGTRTGAFGGSVDDVRIYNRALSATEIRQLYNSGKVIIGKFRCGDTVRGKGSDSINTYGTVLGEDGRCWLDRNLGATTTATAYNTESSYGYLYQWGRGNDGHQIIYPLSSVTETGSNSDSPGHGDFISTSTDPFDWRYPQNDNLWQGVNGANNPCPSGFRLPTGGVSGEWQAYTDAAGLTSCSSNCRQAFASSALKIPTAGARYYNDGWPYDQGNSSYYWSSSPSDTSAHCLYFDSWSGDPTVSDYHTYGFSVRCIKD